MAERTGCPILLSLWSYVADDRDTHNIYCHRLRVVQAPIKTRNAMAFDFPKGERGEIE